MLVIDKARNPGGRLSTREHPLFSFDHGAQFLTTRDSEFGKVVQQGLQNKEITEFTHPEKGMVYIGNPVFKAFISRLTKTFDITQNALVKKIEKQTDKAVDPWRISVKNKKPIFANRIILTTPAPQTYSLIPDFLTELKVTSIKAKYHPCIATLVGIEISELPSINLINHLTELNPILLTKGNIDWSIAKWSRSKDDTTIYLSVIIHANLAFSSKHLEGDVNKLAHRLWQEWKSHVNEGATPDISFLPKHVSYLKGHKWRYAKVSKTPDKWNIRTNRKHKFALAGDWLVGPRIESAWISGRDAANSLLQEE